MSAKCHERDFDVAGITGRNRLENQLIFLAENHVTGCYLVTEKEKVRRRKPAS